MTLSPGQRVALAAVSVFGLLGPNGVFVYYAVFRWDDLIAGLRSPVELALWTEAFVVMFLLAVFIARRPLGRWGWKTFIGLSLIGGLAFSIPGFVLLNAEKRND